MDKQIKVLIADDEENMQELLRISLEKLGCNVDSVVSDGYEALKQLNIIQPDIAFLDIDMPIKSGIDVLEEISASSIKVYPVIVSGHSTPVNVKAALGLGAKGFVVKPYTESKLQQIINKYIKETS